MSVELASLIVGGISTVSSVAAEAHRRQSDKGNGASATALHHIQQVALARDDRYAELAELIPDGMTRDTALAILGDPDFLALIHELILIAILDSTDSDPEVLIEAIASQAEHSALSLSGEGVARSFGSNVAKWAYLETSKIVDEAVIHSREALVAIQQLSQLKRVDAVLRSIERHVSALATVGGREERLDLDKFIASYKPLCAHVHGNIQPPDFENDQRIPLADLYVTPSIVTSSDGSDQRDLGSVDIGAFMASIDRTVVVGDPGGGKSTLSAYVMADVAQRPGDLVPFFVTLREYAKTGNERCILRYIEATIPPRYQVEVPGGVIESLLITGRALIVFDGLDELIDTSKRRQVTAEVEAFSLRYPLAKLLVTSRKVGYEQARLDPTIFRLCEIGEFDHSQVQEYVNKWFLTRSEMSAKQIETRAAEFMLQSEAVPDLRSNPLMLSLMCIIFKGENFIPRKRPAVYEKCANLLFEKWDGHRQIEVPLKARDHVDAAMKYVAYQFLEAGVGDAGIEYDDLVSMMTGYLHNRAMDTEAAARAAAAEFVDFCRGRAWVFSEAGTTADGEQIYTFTHRTFMEYFAAVHLVRTTDSAEKLGKLLLNRVAKEEWDMVAQLAI